jgi:hypothetical protein
METVVEYYTGRDASGLTDTALARKVGHILRLRKMEAEQENVKFYKKLNQ